MVVSKKFPIELSSWKATKCNFLSALVAIVDPLGLIAPLVLPGKLLLQQLWLNKVGWDELLSTEHNQIALKFLKDLSQIGIFEFPRKAVTLLSELHIFVDSSSKAFGAVAYSYDRRTNDSKLLTSKQRVTPCGKKKLTIPKFELTATLVGAKLSRHLMTLFNFSSTHLWTDSSVVLSWLNHLDNLKDVYVSNSTAELRYLIDACTIHMHHNSTKCNPADILSRGCTVKQLVNHQLWLHGPVECMHNVSTNPSSSPHLSIVHVANVLAEIQPIPPTQPVIDISRFSSYNKLIAVVSRILALFKSSRSPLEVIVIQEQKLHCYTLYQYLDNPNMVVPLEIKKLVSQLNLIKESGILKCKGRINKSDLNVETHTPYYLPKQSMLLRLLITHIHAMNSHSPVLPTLTLLRQNFWVLCCHPLVSLLNRNCVTCRKLRPRAYQVPPPPPLPKQRTCYERPFQAVGVDNTGAFTVLMEDGSKSQLYITIFVCATTHAAHLEEVFRTALAEAQAVVNNRPLTYLSNQLDEEPLTPSHLLRGHLVRMFPVVEQDVLQKLQPEPGKRARHQYQLLHKQSPCSRKGGEMNISRRFVSVTTMDAESRVSITCTPERCLFWFRIVNPRQLGPWLGYLGCIQMKKVLFALSK